MGFITITETSVIARRNRTHCIYGHEYTPENTSTTSGHRVCLACRAIQNRIGNARYRAKLRAVQAETAAAERTVLAIVEARKTYGAQIAREVELLMLKGRVR